MHKTVFQATCDLICHTIYNTFLFQKYTFSSLSFPYSLPHTIHRTAKGIIKFTPYSYQYVRQALLLKRCVSIVVALRSRIRRDAHCQTFTTYVKRN